MYESTLVQTRHGAGDPTCRIGESDYARALFTPAGPGVVTVRLVSPDARRAVVETHGPAADWLMDRHRDMLGLNDPLPSLQPVHDSVAEAQKRHGELRLARTRSPYQDLLMAVLGQRITAHDATRQWRRLVLAHGSPAPGPVGLMLPPAPGLLESLPYWLLHGFGIERRRAVALQQVARHADWLSVLADSDTDTPGDLTRSLLRIPGIGPWSAAVAGGTAFGDPDAVRVGDFHVKNTVAWALAGRPRGSDQEMLELLEPYAGQRERVVRWLQAAGWRAPRHGPGRRNVDMSRF